MLETFSESDGQNCLRLNILFQIAVSKTAFTRCRHILKTVKNVTDRPPVHTKTAHFLSADFENGRF